LEGRYRHSKQYRRLAIELGGINPSKASGITHDAILKLSHPYVLGKMSLSHAEQARNDQHEQGANIAAHAEQSSFETSVFEAGFTTRAANALVRSGKQTVESVIEITTFDELIAIRELGIKLCIDIIEKMHQLGHTQWTDLMMSGMESKGVAQYSYASNP